MFKATFGFSTGYIDFLFFNSAVTSLNFFKFSNRLLQMIGWCDLSIACGLNVIRNNQFIIFRNQFTIEHIRTLSLADIHYFV